MSGDPAAIAEAALLQAGKGDGQQHFTQKRLGEWTRPTCAIDVYEGPQGRGYVVREHRTVNDKGEIRCANTGPETYRERDWWAA